MEDNEQGLEGREGWCWYELEMVCGGYFSSKMRFYIHYSALQHVALSLTCSIGSHWTFDGTQCIFERRNTVGNDPEGSR